MNHTAAHQPEARSGFTVLEVLIAVTVFSLVGLVLFSVFSSAIRSQEVTERETRVLQQARFALDTLERDLTNVFFRDETSYNISISRMIEEMEEQRLVAETNGNWDEFYARYGNPYEDEDDQNPSIGNPWEKGIVIDLQMDGGGGGKTDTLTFAAYDPLDEGAPYRPWGLTRVEYRVDKEWLIRRSESVETERRDLLGESLGKKDIPSHSKLAEGVKEFDLQFGFWFDSTWYETEQWNSANRQIRNPRNVLGDYQEEWRTMARDGDSNVPQLPGRDNDSGILAPGMPGWEEYLNDLDNEPLDRLPAYVRVHLVVANPDGKGRSHTFQRVIRVPFAEETWLPDQMLNEEMREEERAQRDDRYVRVYPGAMEDYPR